MMKPERDADMNSELDAGADTGGAKAGSAEKYYDITVKSIKKSAIPIAFDVTISYNDDMEAVLHLLPASVEELMLEEGLRITRGEFLAALDAERLCRAAAAGLRLLGYADNSVFGLARKLRDRGFSREDADGAAYALEELGYIDERRQVALLGASLARRKLIGRYRVATDLRARGYDNGYIKDWILQTSEYENGGVVDDPIYEVNFIEICVQAIKKRGGLPEQGDVDGRGALSAYLFRRGFTSEQMLKAARAIEREKKGITAPQDAGADVDIDPEDEEYDVE